MVSHITQCVKKKTLHETSDGFMKSYQKFVNLDHNRTRHNFKDLSKVIVYDLNNLQSGQSSSDETVREFSEFYSKEHDDKKSELKMINSPCSSSSIRMEPTVEKSYDGLSKSSEQKNLHNHSSTEISQLRIIKCDIQYETESTIIPAIESFEGLLSEVYKSRPVKMVQSQKKHQKFRPYVFKAQYSNYLPKSGFGHTKTRHCSPKFSNVKYLPYLSNSSRNSTDITNPIKPSFYSFNQEVDKKYSKMKARITDLLDDSQSIPHSA